MAYFKCTQDPSRRGSEKKFGGHELHVAMPCEPELTMHGKCVERTLRSATQQGHKAHKGTKTINYIFLEGSTAEDRCINTRTSFGKCITMSRGIKDGKIADPTNMTSEVSKQAHNAVAGQLS
eukprot:NODE_28361_length_479_cov_4.025568.p1 GENE.NODE_28361_length_479_cov_4.025568~~NODE_28361_length_479_cov_4.025568.p1  ORF type:complete len:132 (+),score=18.85 NODE_28361_length_479_cov_4.025568:33-398(+)